MLHEDLIDLDNTLKTCGKSIDKVKIVFSSLWKRHTDTLEVRLRTLLERKRELELRKIVENGEDDSYNCENEDLSLLLKIKSNGGTPFLPPTCQSYLDEETSEINKEFSRTAKESYQHRLYFLKTLYKLVKEHLTDEQLASIQLNKNLRDVLEEKVKNLGHSDQALETLPSAKDIENAIRYWKKNKNKSILVYYHRPSRLEKKEKVFVKDNERKPTISWDRVTLQNIDDVLPQVSHFFPNLTEKSKSSIRDFLKQKREKLKFQLKKKFEILKYEIINVETPKFHTIISVGSNNKSVSTQNTVQIPEGKISTSEVTAASTPSIKTPKKEKDPEKRKQEWKQKQQEERKRLEMQKLSKKTENSTGEEDNNNSSSSLPKLSENTINALSKIFKITSVKNMLWVNFVNAWKELREVIDGVKDEPVDVGGSNRKFRGGPLQEGRKQKPKSFNLHEPHGMNGDTIGPKAITRIAEHFQEKFGWTLEKLKEHGFDCEEKSKRQN